MNSATGSMFSYYIQGETSKNCAGFPTIVNPTTFNMENGTKHLKLANVKHFIAYWDKTRDALLHHPEWKLLKSAGAYQLFELTSNDGKYIYIPKNKPLSVRTANWKEAAMEWIYTIKAIDTPFVLLYGKNAPPAKETPAELSEEDYLRFLSGLSGKPEEVPIWLTLGPFYFPAGTRDETAADAEMVDIGELRPEAGSRQFGRVWRPLLRQGPIFLDSLYNPKFNFISYNCVNINSDREQKALFQYSNDDSARIYLNGKLVVRTPITGLYNYQTREVTLRAGVNKVVYKLEQSVGGVFFHLKITAPDGRPVSGLTYSIGSSPAMARVEASRPSDSPIIEEEIGDQRIRFRTRALHQPHIIKMSYYPNWKVRGAKCIYHVTPNFMLVYPEQEDVILYYGSLPSDTLGRLLSLFGVFMFAGMFIYGRVTKK